MNSIKDIFQEMPGITTTPGIDGEEFNIYSRGFQITTFALDGVPLNFDRGVRPVFNMAEFESVQLLRGAAGLFGGYNDPGGTANLVRKKPLDHNQVKYQQDIGSWSNFREELDATGPLTADGKLRGRAVLSEQNQKYFYDVAKSRKSSAYGALEYDLTSDTLLSAGASHTVEHSTPNQGLPRYLDGTAIDWPTNTCLCVPFARDDAYRNEAFASISQRINDSLFAKASVTYNDQRINALYYGVYATVATNGSAVADLQGIRSISPGKQLAADFSLSGKFTALERHNEFVIGGDYRYFDNDGARSYFYYPSAPVDIFHFNPDQYSDPGGTLSNESVKGRTRNYGIYGNLRLELVKDLHLAVGLRYSYLSLTELDYYPPDPTGANGGVVAAPPLTDKSHSTPNVSLTYDFSPDFTVYGSHTKTYQPQFSARYRQGIPNPPPITGVNDEIGLKWQSPDKKINASIAYYKVTQNNFLQSDFSNPTQNIQLQLSKQSTGIEAEVIGELLPRWAAAISYTYSNNKTLQSTGSTPLSAYAPRNVAKIWTTYRGAPGGAFGRFIVGGGIDFQTDAYDDGYVCQDPIIDPNVPCANFKPFNFTTKAYALLSMKIGYKVDDHVELSLKANNLTNGKRYGASPVESVNGYYFYIQPINFLFSLNAKW